MSWLGGEMNGFFAWFQLNEKSSDSAPLPACEPSGALRICQSSSWCRARPRLRKLCHFLVSLSLFAFIPTLTLPHPRSPHSEDDTIGDLKKLVAAQTGTRYDKIVLKKWHV